MSLIEVLRDNMSFLKRKGLPYGLMSYDAKQKGFDEDVFALGLSGVEVAFEEGPYGDLSGIDCGGVDAYHYFIPYFKPLWQSL